MSYPDYKEAKEAIRFLYDEPASFFEGLFTEPIP